MFLAAKACPVNDVFDRKGSFFEQHGCSTDPTELNFIENAASRACAKATVERAPWRLYQVGQGRNVDNTMAEVPDVLDDPLNGSITPRLSWPGGDGRGVRNEMGKQAERLQAEVEGILPMLGLGGAYQSLKLGPKEARVAKCNQISIEKVRLVLHPTDGGIPIQVNPHDRPPGLGEWTMAVPLAGAIKKGGPCLNSPAMFVRLVLASALKGHSQTELR